MIGGDDIILSTHGLGRLRALDLCARVVLLFWKNAVFQSGATAKTYRSYAEIPLASETELLIYRDHAALERWERFESDLGNTNTMIHLLAYEDAQITMVVDEARAADIKGLLKAIKGALLHTSIQLMPLERAA